MKEGMEWKEWMEWNGMEGMEWNGMEWMNGQEEWKKEWTGPFGQNHTVQHRHAGGDDREVQTAKRIQPNTCSTNNATDPNV